jgi:hypothetical protein
MEPEGYATSFRIYAVTACLRESINRTGQPCVLAATVIPRSKLKLLATLPGTARSKVITFPAQEGELGGPSLYSAIVVRAYNRYGQSRFLVIWSDSVCGTCVY